MEDIFYWNNIPLCTCVHKTTPNEKIIISTSDGKTIFQDNLPEQESFWKRLKKYIEGTNVKITMVRFQYNGQTFNLPDHATHYYFIKRAFGGIGMPTNDTYRIGSSVDKKTISGFEVGYGKVSQFSIPVEKGGFGLIKNH